MCWTPGQALGTQTDVAAGSLQYNGEIDHENVNQRPENYSQSVTDEDTKGGCHGKNGEREL